MLIFPKPHSNCRKCLHDSNCDCLCHIDDITDGKHYEIHREEFLGKVKPVVDLDNFWK